MLKAVIIEDEKHSRETLAGLLGLYCKKDIEVIADADGVRNGINIIRKLNPDVVFLDIQMPDGSGFKLLESLEDISFDVIFTTAYDQFAIKAIKFSALDYLLKPIYPEDLIKAVNRAKEKREKLNTKPSVEVLLDHIKTPKTSSPKIVLSTSGEIHIVKITDIIRCESDNYYTLFCFKDKGTLLVSKTLKENEELLSDYGFIRPHKSHLVNINYIKSFIKDDGGSILMTDESKIPVSRRKRENIVRILNNLT